MYIIKWVNVQKKQVFYTYMRHLIGARTDEYPYMGVYCVGYINGFGHEIIDILYLENGKFYTLEQYYKKDVVKNKNLFSVIKGLLGGN